jgi:hypothetical protein
MKTFKLIRIGMMGIVALIALSFASRAVAAVDAFLWFTDSKGQITKVKIHPDGSFTSPVLVAGTYRWSFGVTHSGTAGSKISGSGEELPKESITLNFTKITISYDIVSPKDPDTGLPTGKRMHKPITITKEIDKASPKMMTNLGTLVIDGNGETVSGTIAGITKDGNKTSMDSWDAK